MKKRFDCGHTGKGSYCHRCKAKADEKACSQLQRDAARASRKVESDNDPIDLSLLRHLKSLQQKARKVLAEISRGTSYTCFLGKRLEFADGDIVSIPIGEHYRILFSTVTSPLTPMRLVHHEEYNNLIRGAQGQQLRKSALS